VQNLRWHLRKTRTRNPYRSFWASTMLIGSQPKSRGIELAPRKGYDEDSVEL